MGTIAYKAFNKDMTCRGYQYEEGNTYTLGSGERLAMCECGFHACINPYDLDNYYNPETSVYHKVELDGTIIRKSNKFDSKVVASQITILEEVSYEDLKSIGDQYIDDTYSIDIEERFLGSVSNATEFHNLLTNNEIKVGNTIQFMDGKYNGIYTCVKLKDTAGYYFMQITPLSCLPVNKDKSITSFLDTELFLFLAEYHDTYLEPILGRHQAKITVDGVPTRICIPLREEIGRDYFDSNFDYIKYLHISNKYPSIISNNFWLRTSPSHLYYAYASKIGSCQGYSVDSILAVCPLIYVKRSIT